jgi:NAD(P)-dependent dehydrogenase (short-subunit alcohol dehydrogenase family)
MAELGFDGKVAIITGGGNGLGREHALEFARRGARVVVNDLGGNIDGSGGSLTAAESVVAEIEAIGGEAVANGDSVATEKGGEAIVKTALDRFGQIDIVVNNAGILRDKTFNNMTEDLLTPVVDVHLKGAFYVTRPAWVQFREQGHGRVINTSSASGILGNFGQTNYGAAKMGLIGFTRVLAAEGAKYNINANAIAPAARTRMTEDLLGSMADSLDPKLVTPLVIWLSHQDCRTTGGIYSAAGGTVARFFIGLTQGTHRGVAISAETVRDDWDAINDETGYIVPRSPADEFAKLIGQWKAAQ